MTTKALRQRLERIEAAAVSTWWEGCEQLYDAFMKHLTDDKLREIIAAAETGGLPTWWADRFGVYVEAVPDRLQQWRKVEALEQRLVESGYQYVYDERGVIVFPGLARP